MSGANQCPSLKRRRSWALNAPMIVERFIAIAPTLIAVIQAASPNLHYNSVLRHRHSNPGRHSCYQTSEL